MAKIKLGLNQSAAWVLAVFAASATGGAFYGLASMMSKSHQMEDDDAHGDTHGAGHAKTEHHESADGSGGHDEGDHNAGNHNVGAEHGSAERDTATHREAPHAGEKDTHNSHDNAPAHTEKSHTGKEHGSSPKSDDHGKGEHGDHPKKSQHEDHGSKDKNATTKTASTDSASDWGYEERNGPSRWSQLNQAYASCQNGKKQSPIDLVKSAKGQMPEPLKFRYYESEIQIHNLAGRSLSVSGLKGMSMTIATEVYHLKKLEMHQPAEHQILGNIYDFEIQLVHEDAKGKLAIVSVLFESDSEAHPALKALTEEAPTAGRYSSPRRLDLAALLPKKTSYFHYMGSLTRPPCTENIAWYVFSTPLRMSSAQLDWVASVMKANARPIQAINGRTVSFRNS